MTRVGLVRRRLDKICFNDDKMNFSFLLPNHYYGHLGVSEVRDYRIRIIQLFDSCFSDNCSIMINYCSSIFTDKLIKKPSNTSLNHCKSF